MKTLRKRSDHASTVKLSIQLGIFVVLFSLLALVELPFWLLLPTLGAFGFVIFALYAPLHETTHETAFASKGLNRIGAWITGLIYGMSPGMHAGFHFEHHRTTNQENDPERGFALPEIPGRIILQVLVGAFTAMLLPLQAVVLSFVPTKHWDKLEAAWAPKRKRKQLAWENRAVAAFWIAGFTAMAFLNPTMILYSVIGIFIGRFIHGFITFAEHDGLTDEVHMIHRSRTTLTNRVFRWFYWNMNYHAEHHTWPAIPWHQLPEAHNLAADSQVITVTGYTNFFLKGQ